MNTCTHANIHACSLLHHQVIYLYNYPSFALSHLSIYLSIYPSLFPSLLLQKDSVERAMWRSRHVLDYAALLLRLVTTYPNAPYILVLEDDLLLGQCAFFHIYIFISLYTFLTLPISLGPVHAITHAADNFSSRVLHFIRAQSRFLGEEWGSISLYQSSPASRKARFDSLGELPRQFCGGCGAVALAFR